MSIKHTGVIRKFNLLAIGLITATSLGTAVLVTRQDQETHYEDLIRNGTASAMMAARNSEYAVYAENQDALSQVIESLDSVPDFAYAAILTKDLRTLAQRTISPQLRIPTYSLADQQLPTTDALFREVVAAVNGRTYIDIIAPVVTSSVSDSRELILEPGNSPQRQATLGYVQIGLSKEGLHKRTTELAISTLGFTSLMVLLGITITVLMTDKIASPIRALSQFTREVSEGKLDQKIEIATGDEIEELATAFNSMVERLAKSRHEVQEYQSTLERRVEERTLELSAASEQAYALADEAKKANRAKSEFLATMSHEIRTPMTAILGYSDLLEYKDQSSEARDSYIQTIRRNGEHLLALINDILDISKIEADRMTIERSECSPIKIASEVALLMRGRAEEKGLTVNLDCIHPIPEMIRSSALRLRQILVNLVGNAIKFTEQGEVRITVRCESPDDQSPCLTFEVADTGIGISEAQVQEIFQPFLQADSSMRRQYGGTGLGLAISERLARLLGGEITVESELGRGSTFKLSINPGPLDGVPTSSTTETAELEAVEDRGKQEEPITLSGRVLLAEDGRDNQRLLSLHLQKAGVGVTIAENGAIACEKAEQAWESGQPFDLILMDLQMPVLDGYGATERLREAGYKGPIVALTAHAMPEDRKQCLAAGCDDYASKPISRSALLALVATYLKPPEPEDT